LRSGHEWPLSQSIVSSFAFAGSAGHAHTGRNVDLSQEVRNILRDVLSLGSRADRLQRDSALLGALPELDSMAVANVIAAIEDRFGVSVDDDEIDGATFATLGSLVDFVASKTS
jgi:acyl carrier protein